MLGGGQDINTSMTGDALERSNRINRISRKGEVPKRSIIGNVKHFLYKKSNSTGHTDHRK